MKRETIALIIWMICCYLLISFVFLSFNIFLWEWYGRLGLIGLWFWGVGYFEKNI